MHHDPMLLAPVPPLPMAAPALSTSVPSTAPTSQPAIPLSPAQLQALQTVEHHLAHWPLVGLAGVRGAGRSTLLREVVRRQGGRLLDLGAVIAQVGQRAPDAADAAVADALLAELAQTDLLVIDDLPTLHLGTLTVRPGFLWRVFMPHLYERVRATGKRLLVSAPTQVHNPMSVQAMFGEGFAVSIVPAFGPADYAAFARNVAGPHAAEAVDFDIVYRYAGVLNGHQLTMASGLLAGTEAPSAETFIASLQRHGIVAANTRVDQVEHLDLKSLPGHEALAAQLESHVVLPLEHRGLARELNLRPKRGVLLYGPPGTGKTSVGRALAHRMKGKFFLIDGSFVSEPPGQFFGRLTRVIEEAKANSPSVLFIDDADVLFGIEHIAGLTRYLLTLLDGLESQTASHVCVMMTAMDVRRIPDALLRSGRVELWLETRLPDTTTRERILSFWAGSGLAAGGDVDWPAIARSTEGLTPADLRRVVGDAKALLAADRVRGVPLREATAYMVSAVQQLRAVHQQLAGVLGADGPAPTGGAGYGAGIGGLAAANACGAEDGW